MNVKTALTVAMVCSFAALGGCASMGHDKDSRSIVSNLSNDPLDTEYVAKINAAAQQRFAVVLWVNPPDKPRSDQAKDAAAQAGGQN